MHPFFSSIVTTRRLSSPMLKALSTYCCIDLAEGMSSRQIFTEPSVEPVMRKSLVGENSAN